ncbi:hypothetical protein [Cytobacillus firmus]|uniref:hypothetical protein n=1 Tax=Cytobacillus firmus TaxID=1399 RepID=UPI0030025C64
MITSNFNSRRFNSVLLNSENNSVSKTSTKTDILIDEINWYRSIPDAIKRFTPSLIDYSTDPLKPFLKLSYIPHPTLSNLLLNHATDDSLWERIFFQIENLFNVFSRFLGNFKFEDMREMYISKTEKRIELFLNQSEIARRIYNKKYFELNGKVMKCPFVTIEENVSRIEKIIYKARIRLIHGDLCFSNMLFDAISDQIFVLDPRGDFGTKGIYGDVRYDMAKIRHSLSGYEKIINNKFDIQYNENKIDYFIFSTKEDRHLQQYWDMQLGNSLQEIKIIEALLYLSMLPLHYENPQRQLVLYSLGTELLEGALDSGG